MAQNTLGHPEFTCNLMKSLNCRHDEINRADERTTFHVKGKNWCKTNENEGSKFRVRYNKGLEMKKNDSVSGLLLFWILSFTLF